MRKVQLGNTDLHFAPLVLGCNVFGWTIDEKTSFEILDAFLEGGFNFIDTADIYCRWSTGVGGESETIIGKWLKQRNNRSKVIVATKVGMDMGDGNVGLSKKYILKAVEASLKRLQTDHIDLYQSHKDDENTKVIETLEAYDQLIKEGKVRYIGASNFSAGRLQESLSVSQQNNLPKYQSLQPIYSLCERKAFEGELENVCIENNLGVINYFPLASGFLSGKYRSEKDISKSIRGEGIRKYMNHKGYNILEALDAVANKHRSKPASVALAWILHRRSVTAPIVSATNTAQLEELFQAVKISLAKEDMELLNEISQN